MEHLHPCLHGNNNAFGSHLRQNLSMSLKSSYLQKKFQNYKMYSFAAHIKHNRLVFEKCAYLRRYEPLVRDIF
jgi:hypothetical protein